EPGSFSATHFGAWLNAHDQHRCHPDGQAGVAPTEAQMMFSTLRKLLASLLLAGLVSLAAAQGDGFNVSAGKQVQASRVAAEGYPDGDGLKLTDGSYEFAWGDMVGWEGTETISLVVDLGELHDSISYVALNAM